MPVPNVTQVIPGAAVSIVLKADQPTGRQVQGIVSNVLTRGNHPRGIKVRLSDGRVGRVQRMHTGDLPAPGSQATESSTTGANTRPRERDNRRSKFQSRDIRLEDGGEAPAEEIDLFSYVKQAKPKKKGAKIPDPEEEEPMVQTTATSTATCPVCGEFEGDEIAVAHHVETHFA